MGVPGSANPLLLAQQDTGYRVQRSIRLNSSDSAYCSRVFSSAGNRKTWTWSGWVKRATLSNARQGLFGCIDAGAANYIFLEFDASDRLTVYDTGVAGAVARVSTAVYRDPSSWYHVLLSYDTTQATANNRVRLYVNNSEVTVFTTTSNPTQNADGFVNSANSHSIGGYQPAAGLYFSGYLADIHFIDGQALTPSSFTEVSATTGQLIPKAYTGSYGTNGFKLDFADNSAATAAALGKDTSGNGNNWTPNNLSVAAGAGNDSLVDTPTSYGTDTSVGGEVRGNYCTLNPLNNGANVLLSNGNLDIALSGANAGTLGTIAFGSGKWYFEATVGGTGNNVFVGIGNQANTATYLYSTTGIKADFSGGYAYGASTTTGDVVGVAFDSTAGSITFYKNGVSQGTAYTGISTSEVFLPRWYSNVTVSTAWSLNFGQRPFAYPVSGFKALCDTNLPSPQVAKPSTVMDVLTYTGNSSTRTLTGLGFSPDLVWMKHRASTAGWHCLYDVVRGTAQVLHTNSTNAETANDPNGYLSAFTSDGFTLTPGSSTSFSVNDNNQPYVAWTWDAGSSTVSNTQGSITSSVRANASAGFSIVTFTSQASGSATVGHGLGVAPQFIITKARNTSNGWGSYHVSIGSGSYIALHSTAAATSGTLWNNTSPTANVFSLGSDFAFSYSMVAYCFAPVSGYSSFGSYTGTANADGPMVWLGFRARWILFKNTNSGVEDWWLHDTARGTYNVMTSLLLPNSSGAEATNTAHSVDILSNGFKIRTTAQGVNGSGHKIIYAAFAENPFQYARAR